MSNFYVAIHNETGDILRGAKGQVAMESEQSLARSIGQNGKVKSIKQSKDVKLNDTLMKFDNDEIIL